MSRRQPDEMMYGTRAPSRSFPVGMEEENAIPGIAKPLRAVSLSYWSFACLAFVRIRSALFQSRTPAHSGPRTPQALVTDSGRLRHQLRYAPRAILTLEPLVVDADV
jgi:hypothetical protein